MHETGTIEQVKASITRTKDKKTRSEALDDTPASVTLANGMRFEALGDVPASVMLANGARA